MGNQESVQFLFVPQQNCTTAQGSGWSHWGLFWVKSAGKAFPGDFDAQGVRWWFWVICATLMRCEGVLMGL